jgi:hypothetical protein
MGKHSMISTGLGTCTQLLLEAHAAGTQNVG